MSFYCMYILILIFILLVLCEIKFSKKFYVCFLSVNFKISEFRIDLILYGRKIKYF